MMPDYSGTLTDKVVVITGGGRGIGRAIALAVAQAGAKVCCTSRTAADLAETVRQIESNGGQGLAVPADMTKLEDAQSLMDQTVAQFGGIDILFINHGINLSFQPIEDSDPQRWKDTIDINLLGVYYCARAAIPHLKQRGAGKIIITGSGMGHRGSPGASAYACAKAGAWMLTRVLAQELWQFDISVNELIPGPVDTNFGRHRPADVEPMPSPTATASEWHKKPEDVVPLAMFLATQPNIGPTAQSFNIMRRDG